MQDLLAQFNKKRKRRYRDAYQVIKNKQYVTRLHASSVHSWEVDDSNINEYEHLLNKKKRSRVGFVETKKRR